jgi:hypothetical protein
MPGHDTRGGFTYWEPGAGFWFGFGVFGSVFDPHFLGILGAGCMHPMQNQNKRRSGPILALYAPYFGGAAGSKTRFAK